MSWLILGALAPSFLITWSAAWFMRGRAEQLGLVDRPGGHKSHTQPVALGGGVAIWLGVVGTFAAGYVAILLVQAGVVPRRVVPELFLVHLEGLAATYAKLLEILIVGTLLTLLGLADDRKQLDWRLRIGLQTLAALAMVAAGWRMTLFVDWPWLTGALSVFWIVGLINSFNMLDNMDGLAAGVAAIAAVMLSVVMLVAPGEPQLFVAGLLLVLAGSLGGFLVHNRYPARLYMGDAGSYLVGFLMAIATLAATFVEGDTRRHALLAPLCVLAIPIYDTLSVVLIRLRQRRSPFQGDQSHFSHRLVKLGMSHRQAVRTIYLAAAACGLGAWLLYQVNLAGAIIVLAMVAAVLLLIARFEWVASMRKRKDE
ncbi:MAG: undecaprenyl/decaprenyl-phosphate alpha-N-acetylglucosaminyl 1-phosphate transferase [Planctomycetales bacterium]|nr:undecaprenyl/decaprenyl-phosphate alpha-N-acetylglucosaminyl 1-phosphate transferase [Planctomycetales bacterium]